MRVLCPVLRHTVQARFIFTDAFTAFFFAVFFAMVFFFFFLDAMIHSLNTNHQNSTAQAAKIPTKASRTITVSAVSVFVVLIVVV